MSGPRRQPRLPWEPFRQMFPGVRNAEVCRLIGRDRRRVWDWVREGIPFWTADRLAVEVGLHPAEIWGWEEWVAAADAWDLPDDAAA